MRYHLLPFLGYHSQNYESQLDFWMFLLGISITACQRSAKRPGGRKEIEGK